MVFWTARESWLRPKAERGQTSERQVHPAPTEALSNINLVIIAVVYCIAAECQVLGKNSHCHCNGEVVRIQSADKETEAQSSGVACLRANLSALPVMVLRDMQRRCGSPARPS